MAHKDCRVLILGGCGFIGRHLVTYLTEDVGLEKVVVADKVPPALAWFDEHDAKMFDSNAVEFRSCNLMNQAGCEKAFGSDKFDYVINLAGETRLGLNEMIYEDGIYKLSLNCANLAAKTGVKRFIELSSGMMFSNGDKPHKENEAANPWTHFAKFKLKVESELKDIGGLNYCVIRPATVYGKSDYKSFVPRLVIGGIYKYLNEPMKVLYGPDLAANTVHVADVCRAIWHLCLNGAQGQIYHVVDETETDQRILNNIVNELFGVKTEYLGTAVSSFAKLDLEGVLEDVNEKHMIPWAELCQKDSIVNTPISPYISAEALLNKPVSLDGTKLKETGFKLEHPIILSDELAEIMYDLAARKLVPGTMLES